MALDKITWKIREHPGCHGTTFLDVEVWVAGQDVVEKLLLSEDKLGNGFWLLNIMVYQFAEFTKGNYFWQIQQ